MRGSEVGRILWELLGRMARQELEAHEREMASFVGALKELPDEDPMCELLDPARLPD